MVGKTKRLDVTQQFFHEIVFHILFLYNLTKSCIIEVDFAHRNLLFLVSQTATRQLLSLQFLAEFTFAYKISKFLCHGNAQTIGEYHS